MSSSKEKNCRAWQQLTISKKLSEGKPKAQAELSVYLVRRTWRGVFEPSKANIKSVYMLRLRCQMRLDVPKGVCRRRIFLALETYPPLIGFLYVVIYRLVSVDYRVNKEVSRRIEKWQERKLSQATGR